MSFLFNNYGRKSFEIVSGEGSYLTADNGKTYLDFTSGIGVCNLGYSNQKLQAALVKQSQQLWHTPNLYQNSLQEKAAEKLAQGKDYVAFFCNSGTEANEAAIKLARKSTGKTKIITFLHGFHGRTYGAMSATAQAHIQEGFAPLVPDFDYVPYNDLAALKAALDSNTAAVMLEIIQGEGGVLPADATWLKGVAKACKQNGTLLIIDEVQTGMGRTGKLFAFEHYDLDPDIISMAKGLANGFPTGGILGKVALASAFGPGSHGSTFGGNKMAMAAANEVLDQLLAPGFFPEVNQKAAYMFDYLTAVAKNSPMVAAIRGKGFMVGLEMAEGFDVAQVMATLEEKGLLTLRAGKNVLRLLPPLTTSQKDLEYGLGLIADVLVKEA
jgi:acetylornithine aminotransferase